MRERIHPELQPYLRRMPTLPLHSRPLVALLQLLMPLMPLPKAGPDVAVETRKLRGARVCIFRPSGVLSGAGLLWIHGGGLVIGSAAQDARLCAALARDLRLVVVSVDYRLAPKHPFPAASDDCFEAWQWLQGAAGELGMDPARIAVAGQSAGGGLAAALAQRIHDHGGVQPVGQVLFCPMLDDRTATRAELDGIDYLLWNQRSNRAAWSWYLGAPAGGERVPPYAAAARREQLEGLPPAWLSVGDLELFYDEACRYAERLAAAGVPCHLHVASQGPHAFESLAPTVGPTRELMQSCYAFLRDTLQVAVPAVSSFCRDPVAGEVPPAAPDAQAGR